MKKLSFLKILSLLITFTEFTQGQAPDTLWTRSIGGSGTESAVAVFVTGDGGFITGGYTSSFGSTDYYLVKTNSMGELMWEDNIGETDRNETLTCMIKTSDGGYLLAGNQNEDPPYSSNADIFLVKTDADGNTQWTSIIGDDGVSENPWSVAQTADGGYILCGTQWVDSQTGFDVFLRKTDAGGGLTWTEFISFEPGMADYGYWVEVAPDNGYLVTGKTQAFSGDYSDNAYILKTDAAGATQWLITYGDPWPYYEGTYRLVKASDGGYLISGFQNDDGADNNWYVVKASNTGIVEWQHAIGGTYHEKAFNACETSDSGFAVTGNYHEGYWHAFITRYKDNGDTLWTKMWGAPDHTYTCYDIKQLDDGGFIVAGTVTPNGGSSNIYLTRLAPEGPGTGINENTNVLSGSKLFGITPNPFESITYISYDIEIRQKTTLDIFDLAGKKVLTLVDEIQEPGKYQVEINQLPGPGVYFCLLYLNGNRKVEKLVRIK